MGSIEALKRLRRRCKDRLEELAIPSTFDVRSFCLALGERRNRSILLHSIAGVPGLVGLWVAGPGSDHVFYEEETSPLHQDHIILHEVCHLLCGHQPAPASDVDFSRLLFPDLSPDTIQRVLQRTSYSTEQEQEAEILASLILERVGRRVRKERTRLDPEAGQVLRKLEASLEKETGADS